MCDSIQYYIATSKIPFTRKVILHMQCEFQAVSQQLEDRCFEIRSVPTLKVAITILGL